jgi:hypothetical protein
VDSVQYEWVRCEHGIRRNMSTREAGRITATGSVIELPDTGRVVVRVKTCTSAAAITVLSRAICKSLTNSAWHHDFFLFCPARLPPMEINPCIES